MRIEKAHTLLLRPRDPIRIGDGRPFSADSGGRAGTLPWVLPQTLAGALRTAIGTAAGFDWSRDGPDRARRIQVSGPVLVGRRGSHAEWTPYVPAPFDAVPYATHAGVPRVRCRRPIDRLPEGAGCDLPHPRLRLAAPVESETGKRHAEVAFWSLNDAVDALSTAVSAEPPHDWLGPLPRETRVHVRIDPASQASVEGGLFAVTGLVFADAPTGHSPATAIACRVDGAPEDWQPVPTFVSLGGERRMVALSQHAGLDHIWNQRVAACTGARRLRLQLVTPAIFEAGWRPGWVEPDTLEGSPPGLRDIRLRLVSAVVDRRLAISGWDAQHRRPKRVRYAAPAGSVYFFEVLDTSLTEEQTDALWLHAISDDHQDRLDGFGLVLPGVW